MTRIEIQNNIKAAAFDIDGTLLGTWSVTI